jgi:hypothetical protein
MLKKNIIVLMLISFIILLLFSGCNEQVEKNKFILKSWTTKVNEKDETHINIEFDNQIKYGFIKLIFPSGNYNDSKPLNIEMKNISFIISESKFNKPILGNYTLIINEKKLDTENIVFSINLSINVSKIIIDKCVPTWTYNEGLDNFELVSINLTLTNVGDIFGFIWEGRIIVDNSSIFRAPDYHWHDLNLWFKPEQEITIDLPVEVPWLDKGTHFIQIFMQDSYLNTVVYYETLIDTP